MSNEKRYILILPAFGIISHIISTYAGRPVFGQIWPILEKSIETNYMRESDGGLLKYYSISLIGAIMVKSLSNENYNLQITKARIERYKLRTGSNQLSMRVGISEAIRLLTTHNKREERRGWNEWLAGLIDGDGCFLMSKKGYASLEIVMETRDKHCLYQIKQIFGGSVKLRQGVKWLRYRLHHKKGLMELIEAVNGEIRNPVRIIQLGKICEKYSIELRLPGELRYENGWLAGLIDSDGSVKMNDKSGQIMITVGQKNKLILDLLPGLYGGKVYVERTTGTFTWVVYRKEEIRGLREYLKENPLRSEKKKRILLIKRYEELRELKAHLATENSVLGKAWGKFKRKWESYEG